MNAEDLLAEVEALGVTVDLDGDVLRFRPGSAIPAGLVEELRAHKPELVELVSLRGWPDASRECVRQFGRPEARLYPFLGKTVATRAGRGRLLQVFHERASVLLESDPRKVVTLLPSEVWPLEIEAERGHPFESVH
jgi:hypothetical protein